MQLQGIMVIGKHGDEQFTPHPCARACCMLHASPRPAQPALFHQSPEAHHPSALLCRVQPTTCRTSMSLERHAQATVSHNDKPASMVPWCTRHPSSCRAPCIGGISKLKPEQDVTMQELQLITRGRHAISVQRTSPPCHPPSCRAPCVLASQPPGIPWSSSPSACSGSTS